MNKLMFIAMIMSLIAGLFSLISGNLDRVLLFLIMCQVDWLEIKYY